MSKQKIILETEEDRLKWLLAHSFDSEEAAKLAKTDLSDAVLMRGEVYDKTGDVVPVNFDMKFKQLEIHRRNRFRSLLGHGFNWSESLFWAKQSRTQTRKMRNGGEVTLYRNSLCGAAQSRRASYVQYGFTNDEAFRLAVNVTNARLENRSTRLMPARISLVNYPATEMTRLQSLPLKTAIMDHTKVQNDPNVNPLFTTMFFVNGYVLVPCLDQATINWLEQIVSKLKPWEGATLRMISKQDMLNAADSNVIYLHGEAPRNIPFSKNNNATPNEEGDQARSNRFNPYGQPRRGRYGIKKTQNIFDLNS